VLLVGIHYDRVRSNPTADARTTVHSITIIDRIFVQTRLTLPVAGVEPQLLARVSLDSEDALAPGLPDTRMAYLAKRDTRRLSCDMSGECFRNPALAPVDVATATPARR
jgi:hypothetical protein